MNAMDHKLRRLYHARGLSMLGIRLAIVAIILSFIAIALVLAGRDTPAGAFVIVWSTIAASLLCSAVSWWLCR
jgi:uncharacterized membrane protein YphA (DoxX/SURF4 family)